MCHSPIRLYRKRNMRPTTTYLSYTPREWKIGSIVKQIIDSVRRKQSMTDSAEISCGEKVREIAFLLHSFNDVINQSVNGVISLHLLQVGVLYHHAASSILSFIHLDDLHNRDLSAVSLSALVRIPGVYGVGVRPSKFTWSTTISCQIFVTTK